MLQIEACKEEIGSMRAEREAKVMHVVRPPPSTTGKVTPQGEGEGEGVGEGVGEGEGEGEGSSCAG